MQVRLFDYAAIAVSLAAFLLFLSFGFSVSPEAKYVSIRSNDGEYLYNLADDRTFAFEGPMGVSEIVIEGGSAHFGRSDCDDHLCEAMGVVEHSGEWAACLPNQVFLTILGDEDRENRETDS